MFSVDLICGELKKKSTFNPVNPNNWCIQVFFSFPLQHGKNHVCLIWIYVNWLGMIWWHEFVDVFPFSDSILVKFSQTLVSLQEKHRIVPSILKWLLMNHEIWEVLESSISEVTLDVRLLPWNFPLLCSGPWV